MKKIVLWFALLLPIFFSCKKEYSHEAESPQEQKPDFIDLPNRPNPGKFMQTLSGEAVIFIDFDGQTVANTSWNTNGPIYAAASQLSPSDQTSLVNMVKERYSTFNVIVTTDSTVYWAGDQYHRIRVIVTPTWQWYGAAGGVAFTNSFTWGTNEVCWVFDVLLNNDVQKCAASITHEAGHTLGLRHQCIWKPDCSGIQTPYNPGSGTGATSWAPTMGVAYGKALWTFTLGHDSQTGGCTTLTDEYAVLNNDISNVADDIGDDTYNAEPQPNNTTIKYALQTTTDVDAFSIPSGKWSCAVTVTTYGTCDIAVDVYNSSHVLKETVDPTDVADIARTSVGGVIKGYQPKYFVVRNTTANGNVPAGSLRGSYSLKLEY